MKNNNMYGHMLLLLLSVILIVRGSFAGYKLRWLGGKDPLLALIQGVDPREVPKAVDYVRKKLSNQGDSPDADDHTGLSQIIEKTPVQPVRRFNVDPSLLYFNAILDWIGQRVEGLKYARMPSIVDKPINAQIGQLQKPQLFFWNKGETLSEDTIQKLKERFKKNEQDNRLRVSD